MAGLKIGGSCHVVGDRLSRLWRLCDPGVAGGKWVACRGDRVLERVGGTVRCGSSEIDSKVILMGHEIVKSL